jgi:3-demethoxyubiquinol 3-hydroxylase
MTETITHRILKVNHAGEYGAIHIYKAQKIIANKRYPELTLFLHETLQHEIEHYALFEAAMQKRNVKPCGLLFAWKIGGFALGFVTALLGKNALLVCTKAVEQTVHMHLEEQLDYVQTRDDELFQLIDTIKNEELAHLSFAIDNITKDNGVLEKTIAFLVEALIFISTQGDSLRVMKDLSSTK